MINNYGLLWERRLVHLGAGGNRGTLLGRHPDVGIVDFREQMGIYVLYDKDLVAVYVGQAGNGNATLFSRLKAHTKGRLRGRWEYFSWFGLRRVNDGNRRLSGYDHINKLFKEKGSSVLNLVEGALISAMEPKLNRQGGRFKTAKQFFQTVDENIEDVSLNDVMSRLEKLQQAVDTLKKAKQRK